MKGKILLHIVLILTIFSQNKNSFAQVTSNPRGCEKFIEYCKIDAVYEPHYTDLGTKSYVSKVKNEYHGDVYIPATETNTTGIPRTVTGIMSIENPYITSVNFTHDEEIRIYHDAFWNCTALKSIYIKNFDIDYGSSSLNNPFHGCTSLESFNGQKYLCSQIGLLWYAPASKDKSFSFTFKDEENQYKYICKSCFRDAIYLENVSLPNATTFYPRAFKGCTSLKTIDAPELKRIYPAAFQGCSSIESFSIPKGMTVLQGETFDGCSSLKEIFFPEDFYIIAYRAFRGCKSLKHIDIPQTVTAIYVQAFKDCTGLTEITLPEDLKEFGPEVFTGCTSLSTIHANMQTAPEAEGNVFDESTYRNATLYVPAGTIDSYRTTLPWSNFTTIKERDTAKN